MFTSQLVMDVLDELEEKSATHSTHDASEVVILTDFARKHGASKASRIWADLHKDSKNFKAVPAPTFQKYKGFYYDNIPGG